MADDNAAGPPTPPVNPLPGPPQTANPAPTATPPTGPAVLEFPPPPAATQAYYSNIEMKLDAKPPRLDFIRAKGTATPPVEARALRRQIEDVARLARILFQDDPARLKQFFTLLHLTAFSGLCGAAPSIEIGMDNLQDVKESITDAFPVIRGRIWLSNLVLLLAVAAVCAAVGGAYYFKTGNWMPDLSDGKTAWPALAVSGLLIPLGVVVGLFAEFVLRVGDDIPYEQLRAINPGRWRPLQRALNTVIIAYVFAGLLAIGAFKIGVASSWTTASARRRPCRSS